MNRNTVVLALVAVCVAAALAAVGIQAVTPREEKDGARTGGKGAETAKPDTPHAETPACTASGKAMEKPEGGQDAQGKVKPAPKHCPACAMGLTAEWVFNRLDVNEDKKVSAAEFRQSPGMDDEAKAKEAVGRIDTTNDGILSWQEFEAAYKLRHANCIKPKKGTPPNLRPDGRGDANRFVQVFIMRSDTNDDGVIDKSEFRGPDAGFDRMDKNHNGKLDPEEIKELHAKRLSDPKSMRERLKDGSARRPPPWVRPQGMGSPKGGEEAEKK